MLKAIAVKLDCQGGLVTVGSPVKTTLKSEYEILDVHKDI